MSKKQPKYICWALIVVRVRHLIRLFNTLKQAENWCLDPTYLGLGKHSRVCTLVAIIFAPEKFWFWGFNNLQHAKNLRIFFLFSPLTFERVFPLTIKKE